MTDSTGQEIQDGDCPFDFPAESTFEEKVIHALRVMYLDLLDLAESVAESALGDTDSDSEM